MPSYDVLVSFDVSFPGGIANGSGGILHPGMTHGGAMGVEVQLITITCKIGCSDATVKKLALTEARKFIVQQAMNAKYDWVNKGIIVKHRNSVIVGRHQ